MDDSSAQAGGGTAGFVGREEELSHLLSCAEKVAAGESWVMLVEGEAGIGKTALIRQALARLDGFFVVSLAGDSTEVDYPYGLVDQLVRKVPPALLRGFPVLERAAGSSMAAFRVGAELLGLLGALQSAGPVAVLLDDVQWADRFSVQAFGFASRRSWADRLLILMSARTPGALLGGAYESQPAMEQCRRLVTEAERSAVITLGGLSEQEVRQLATEGARGRRAGTVAREVWQRTEGHPLYVRTLLAEVPAEDLAQPGGSHRVPRSLSETLGQQLAALPPESQAVLEALAVLDRRVPLASAGALAGVEDPVAALEALLHAEFVTWWPGEATCPLEIRHALQRDAVYEQLLPQRRQELHRAAADMVDTGSSWGHRVAAAGGVDEELAQELEVEADRLLAEDSVDRAATMLLWASDLSGSRQDRERRLLTAVACLAWADRFSRIEPLLSAINLCAPSSMRSLALGSYAMSRGDPNALALLSDAWQARAQSPEPWLGAMAGGWLGMHYLATDHFEEAIEVTQQVLSMSGLGPRLRNRPATVFGAGHAFGRGAHEGVRAFAEVTVLPDRASANISAPSDGLLLTNRGLMRLFAGELTNGADDLKTALLLGRSNGLAVMDELAYAELAYAQFVLGAWDDASLNIEHALTVSVTEDRPWGAAVASGYGALLAAAKGDWQRANAHVQRAAQSAIGPTFEAYPALGAAAIAQAKGDPSGMLRALSELLAHGASSGTMTLLRACWLPLHVEALIGAGHLEEATKALVGLQEFAVHTPYLQVASAWLAGQLAQQQGDPHTARDAYEQGAALPTSSDDCALHRAFLEHSYGRLLAATRERRSGTDHLRTAHSIYSALGAGPFLERCAHDLADCGLQAPTTTPDQLMALTDREADIARLVSEGLTNQEAASQLFVSIKTVEYHLSHIYTKLGVANRRELIRRAQAAEVNIGLGASAS